METKRLNPIVIHSDRHPRPISFDITYSPTAKPKPVILHIHGFKGFKDWGYFNLMAEEFARQGFIFVKMNFSHNGVTLDDPVDFVDLEAFGRNNFSIEQSDIEKVIDFLRSGENPVSPADMDRDRLFLTGHSRGGTAAILKGHHDDRVNAIAAWAAINDYAGYFPEKVIAEWEKNSVIYVENSRTGQQMPLYYQMVEDYIRHEDRLNVPRAVKALKKPLLLVHGTADPTVPVEAAFQMKAWNPAIELHTIDGADHVFGGSHPYGSVTLPEDAREMIRQTIDFFNRIS